MLSLLAATLLGWSQKSLTEQPQWQKIDQLCGQVELERPTSKKIIVNGKAETRLYTTYLEGATLTLFSAHEGQAACCEPNATASTRSGRYGAFEFRRVPKGMYWLRVQQGGLSRVVPIRLTEDFNVRVCRSPSARRSVIVDSNPPRVQLRIR